MKHKVLSWQLKEDIILAGIIDVVMDETGEGDSEKVIAFVRRYGS